MKNEPFDDNIRFICLECFRHSSHSRHWWEDIDVGLYEMRMKVWVTENKNDNGKAT